MHCQTSNQITMTSPQACILTSVAASLRAYDHVHLVDSAHIWPGVRRPRSPSRPANSIFGFHLRISNTWLSLSIKLFIIHQAMWRKSAFTKLALENVIVNVTRNDGESLEVGSIHLSTILSNLLSFICHHSRLKFWMPLEKGVWEIRPTIGKNF